MSLWQILLLELPSELQGALRKPCHLSACERHTIADRRLEAHAETSLRFDRAATRHAECILGVSAGRGILGVRAGRGAGGGAILQNQSISARHGKTANVTYVHV